MDNKRYVELDCVGRDLTQEEMAQGWHYCPEWDYMLTNMNNKEVEQCSCTPWVITPNV
jgi:hypothetical protein